LIFTNSHTYSLIHPSIPSSFIPFPHSSTYLSMYSHIP